MVEFASLNFLPNAQQKRLNEEEKVAKKFAGRSKNPTQYTFLWFLTQTRQKLQ